MSRSHSHSKKWGKVRQGKGHKQRAIGFEFWTARPGNYQGLLGYGPEAKDITHKHERRTFRITEDD